MTEPPHRHLVIWEARHDNGWTTLVMEQSDGTFVAWAGPDESVGVDYVEDTPEHAQAAAMFGWRVGSNGSLSGVPSGHIWDLVAVFHP